ncbi:hypothetical protein E2562_018816 [Oryza meyeriana var. granulata]|uniref:Uncharacterized protein n=1 Tax=Oryza meyeriana var. granulata TaxID=110450 RepID=A0A6G1F9P9_9ORYZ|nr:hypothetical protein E2562_018816 [Oryza meyeriana var. granulata]
MFMAPAHATSCIRSSCRMRRVAMFFRQIHALLLKNLSFQRRNAMVSSQLQRRNAKANVAIAAFPVLLCVLLVAIQGMIDHELDRPPFRCGCACVHRNGRTGACAATECGVQHSASMQALSCAVPAPPRWLALVHVPDERDRALMPVHPARCGGGGAASEAPCPSRARTASSLKGTRTLPANVLSIEPRFDPNGTICEVCSRFNIVVPEFSGNKSCSRSSPLPVPFPISAPNYICRHHMAQAMGAEDSCPNLDPIAPNHFSPNRSLAALTVRQAATVIRPIYLDEIYILPAIMLQPVEDGGQNLIEKDFHLEDRPYDCKVSDSELHYKGHIDATKELAQTSYLHAAEKKVPGGMPCC